MENEESKRLQNLHHYRILDSLAEEEFDRITELASIICEVPISLISLLDKDRQWFKSKIGLDIEQTDRNYAFCNYAILTEETFEVEDATQDSRFKNNPLVTGNPNIRFYAGHPLIDDDGCALGTLCIIDRKAKILNEKQKRALQILSKEVMALIIERRKKVELKNFENLFKLSNDLLCVIGQDGYFKKVNPAFKKILAWDDEQLMTMSLFELIHPEDVPLTKQAISQLGEGTNSINFSHRFRVKDKGYKILQWVATLEPLTGDLFAIARDITEEKAKELALKTSEEKSRVFFENSQSFMCTHDLEGNFKSVNDAGASILGYRKDEILVLSLYNIIPNSRKDFIDKYLKEIKEFGQSSGQMVTICKDGSYKIWIYNNILEKTLNGENYVIGNAVDITERHFLEEDLKKTKATLEQINRVAHVGGWELDLRKGKISWTNETKEIHGVKSDYEPNLNNAIQFYKEGPSRDAINLAINKAIVNGDSWDLELQIINTKGREVWVRALGSSEFENGICKRVYGTFQDIDERKRNELEIHQSRNLLNNVLQAASEISIIATDNKGIITVFNKGAEKLLGYNSKEVIGKKTPDFVHLAEEIENRSKELTKEFGYKVEGFRVFVERIEKTGSEIKEWTYITKSGAHLTVSLVITAIKDLNNQISGYLGIATDITERRIVEQALMVEKSRLFSFVEHAPAAVAMFDTELKYVAVSKRWLEDYHFGSLDIIGMSYYDLFKNIDLDREDRLNRILNGEIERKEIDTYRLEGDTEDQYFTWEMRPWYQYDGKIGGIMLFTQNITSLIKQQEELEIAKFNAEQASIAKSEFLANMSHEIRTPLNGVIGFTDLVLKTNLSDVQQQYLSIVNQSANGLLSIINDILDFSKIEAGKLELDLEKCNIYEIAAHAADTVAYQVQTKGLEMLLHLSSNLPSFIYCDALRLKQILINLLGNASKFTEKGEIELKIELLSNQQDMVVIRFTVRDTGIGIKTEKQTKIFDAFSQEDGSTTKKYGGTGLGLTISNRLLKLMNSYLQVESIPEQGSTFFFDVEFKIELNEEKNWDLEGIKQILIVDDNDNSRLILTEILLEKQIAVKHASNGFEALQLVSQGEKFDIVIIDYQMPIMNGLETVKKMREDLKYTESVILLSNSSDEIKINKACEELDIKSRIVKPIKREDVYCALSNLNRTKNIGLAPVDIYKVTLKDYKILIVEDNAVNMFLAKTIIKKIAPRSHIFEAKNGFEAIELFKKQEPDLVLMDIQMPEMNGYQATQAIREIDQKAHTPIVALTAGNVKGEKEKCLESGMDDFVTKPFIEETIKQLFCKWLKLDLSINSDINENRTSISHFDKTILKEFLGEDEDMIKATLNLVLEELEKIIITLDTKIGNKDLKGIKELGHKLYGTSSSSGFMVLADISRKMELLESFIQSEIKELSIDLKNEIKTVIEIINKTS